MPYTLATQPEKVSRLLSRSLELYRRSFFRIFLPALILSIVAFIPRLVGLALGHDIFSGSPTFSPLKFCLLLLDISCLTFLIVILWRLQNFIMGRLESFKDDFKIAIKKLPFIIVAAIIQSLILLVILLVTYGFYAYLQQQNLLAQTNMFAITLIGLPFVFSWMLYIYIFYLFSFYLPIILTENAGIISSLLRSAHLVWKNWWRTFWVQSIPWIIYLCILMAVKFGAHVNIHIYFVKAASQSLWATLLHIFIFALFVPWFAANLLVQLRDLELRKKI